VKLAKFTDATRARQSSVGASIRDKIANYYEAELPREPRTHPPVTHASLVYFPVVSPCEEKRSPVSSGSRRGLSAALPGVP